MMGKVLIKTCKYCPIVLMQYYFVYLHKSQMANAYRLNINILSDSLEPGLHQPTDVRVVAIVLKRLITSNLMESSCC